MLISALILIQVVVWDSVFVNQIEFNLFFIRLLNASRQQVRRLLSCDIVSRRDRGWLHQVLTQQVMLTLVAPLGRLDSKSSHECTRLNTLELFTILFVFTAAALRHIQRCSIVIRLVGLNRDTCIGLRLLSLFIELLVLFLQLDIRLLIR